MSMYVRVRVTANAKKETIIETEKQTLSISVKEPARQNMANERVRELVAREYGVDVKKVQMITGHRSPQKMFSIDL